MPSSPGFSGAPDIQEAGALVTIRVRAVEDNYWTAYPVPAQIAITSSSPAYTIIDGPKNLASGEADFYVRLLRPDMSYSITATDLLSSLLSGVSAPIPVAVSPVGNHALTDYAPPEVDTVAVGQAGVRVMEFSINNPNAGPVTYAFKGVTLTVSLDSNTVIDSAELRNSAGTVLGSASWGAGKTVFVPADVLIGGLETAIIDVYVNIHGSAGGETFTIAVENNVSMRIEKMNGSVVYCEPAGRAFPYVSDIIITVTADLQTSFYSYPNPFNPSKGEAAKIQYYLDSPADASLAIYDLAGRKVRVLAAKQPHSAGVIYRHEWDGKNDSGKTVLSGVYYSVLEVAGRKYFTKTAVVR